MNPQFIRGGQLTAVGVEDGTVNVVLCGVIWGMVSLSMKEVGKVGSEFAAVVAKLVKHVVARVAFEVFNRVEPLIISFFRVKVKDGRVPKAVNLGLGEDSVRKITEFLVSGRAHAQARQSILNGDGKEVAIGGLDTLQSANTNALVTDIMSKHFPLTGGVNAGGLVSQCILVHDPNDRSLVGVDDTGTGANLDGGHPVVVNAFNVNFSVWKVLVQGPHITAGHDKISAGKG